MSESGKVKHPESRSQGQADEQPPGLRDFVAVYEDVLSADLCEDIIARFEAEEAHHVRRGMRNIRAFTELNIDELPEWRPILETLEGTAKECFAKYRESHPGMFPPHHEFESFRIKRYQPGKGEVFSRHVDAYDNITALRFLVLFWYLNDVDEGGETWFPALKVRVRPRRGRVLMFPPFWMYEHAGLKPVSNDKYIIGSYFTFPVPRD